MLLPNSVYLALGAAILTFVAGWTVRSWKAAADDQATVRAAQEQFDQKLARRDAAHAADIKRTKRIEGEHLNELARYNLQAEQLRAAAARVPLTRTVVEKINEACSCPRTNLSRDFGVCFAAGVSGTAEAIAACAANGGDEAVSPGPGSVFHPE